MILDRIDNIGMYACLNKNLKKAAEFIKENNLEEFPVGRYEIDGDNVFLLIQEYTSKNENDARWESHKKYIDIQYVLQGEEIMGYKNISELTLAEDLYEQKDAAYYQNIEIWTKLIVKAGEFAIFFPGDGHKPCCAIGRPQPIMKAVIKVRV